MPLSVWERDEFRVELINALELAVKLFQQALERGVPFEDARYLLPEGSLSLLEFEGTI
jgi:thymidylate synthase ThyX